MVRTRRAFPFALTALLLCALPHPAPGQPGRPTNPQSTPAAPAPGLTFIESMIFGDETIDGSPGRLGNVTGVVVDSRGVVHILDGGFHCVHRYSADGIHLGRYGAEGEGPGDFRRPQAIAVGPDDHIYVGGLGSLIAVFAADGSHVQSFERSSATHGSQVRSIAVDHEGYVYLCAVDGASHTVIHKHAPGDHALVASFGDTYAVGHDVDPRAEQAFGGGHLTFLPPRSLVLAQMAPPVVRIFDRDGRLRSSVDILGSDGDIPDLELDGNQRRFVTPEFMSRQVVAVGDSGFLVVVARPLRDQERRSSFAGTMVIDHRDLTGRRLGTANFDRQFVPEFVDDPGRVYVSEIREIEGDEIPVVVRYEMAPTRPATKAAGSPRTQRIIRAPGDSVLARVGEHQQWVDLTDITSPDTTYIGIDADLIFASELDTVTIPYTEKQALVSMVREADTLQVLVTFESPALRDLERRVSTLRQYSRYESDPAGPNIEFADVGNPSSGHELRHTFDLTTVAGTGNDLARMRNLRRWLHESVTYDGSKDNPKRRSVVQAITACSDSGLTMNCGGMASTYVALCKAVGLPARQIVCRSLDPDDPDCHSVAVVYCDSLKQWVYMDPAFNAEWTDADGRLLDLQMARDNLVAGAPIFLNSEAMVHGSKRDEDEHLAYMAKNLFQFQTWTRTWQPAYLVPKGFDVEPKAPSAANASRDTTTIVTSDPDRFWAAPSYGERSEEP